MNARLYPSLGVVGMSDLNEEEDDPLADLEIVAPKPKRPPRPPRPPPPTRAHSLPTALHPTPTTPQLETCALQVCVHVQMYGGQVKVINLGPNSLIFYNSFLIRCFRCT